jgi:hypothetical protein
LRLEGFPFARFDLGALFGGIQRALTRIHFAGRQTAWTLLHQVGEKTIGLGNFRRLAGISLAGTSDRPLLLLFDDDGLRPSMAETLPDMSSVNRALEAQRLARAPFQGLVGSLIRLGHARPVSASIAFARAVALLSLR